MNDTVNHQEEIWKPIGFLDGKYDVSDQGRIRHAQTGRIRKTPTSKRGYPVFSATVEGKRKLITVHKCVASEFAKMSLGCTQVNHIDGNKTNNVKSNLEWVTAQENMLHARRTGLHKSDGQKPVYQVKDGKIVGKYNSISEASRITGIDRSSIGNVIHKRVYGERHFLRAGGYDWRFVNE